MKPVIIGTYKNVLIWEQRYWFSKKRTYSCSLHYTLFEEKTFVANLREMEGIDVSYSPYYYAPNSLYAFSLIIRTTDLSVLQDIIRENVEMEILPPWLCFPNIFCDSMAWRQGNTEYWYDRWVLFWKLLNEREKRIYLEKYPPPKDWVQKIAQY